MTKSSHAKQSPYLVVLDIDDTLVHSRDRPLLGHHDGRHILTFPNSAVIVYTYTRPGLRQFIDGLKALPVRIAVWTAATKSYAIKVLDKIFPEWRSRIEFLWTRSKCTRLPCGNLFKDLSLIPPRTRSDSIILVDDSETHAAMNTTNHPVYRIAPFQPGKGVVDRHLDKALAHIARHVNKRARFAVPSVQ